MLCETVNTMDRPVLRSEKVFVGELNFDLVFTMFFKIVGGWWCLDNFASLTGQVCIEIQPQCYVRARDNGTFIVGQPHNVGEGPDQEEILTCIRVGDSQIALKSGYNKYLAITASDSKLIGVSDAVGQREMFEPIFQDGKLAISACNGCFLAPDDEEGHHLYAKSKKATDAEFVKIRSNVDPERIKRDKERSAVPSEERGSLLDCEQKYMKKFQSHADGNGGKLLAGGAGQLKKAKDAGSLHEVLLDRRAKIKSDKFCK